jgi:hypothetical protein
MRGIAAGRDADPAIYRDASEAYDALRARIRAGISRIARKAKVRRSVVQRS